ncbi:hypothetical protein SAMN05444157_1655 [Frankineae bacterium MT45]|nr:hypothetical protein SAMN05444157_1655 [Frankineae bacterium MT45]
MTSDEFDLDGLRWVLDDLAYHQSRVLMLIDAVASEPGHNRKLDGLTKLAKLDFLVRYPALATFILDGLDEQDTRLHLAAEDRLLPTDVADPMVRYKYGPWDDRYYPVVGALVSRELVRYARGRRGSVALVPTAKGRGLVGELRNDAGWQDVADRCVAIAQASTGLTGNAIKERIYERLADLMDRPHREVIL